MKNLHITHIEDSILEGNMHIAHRALYSVFEFLQDKPSHHFNLTIKYDGAPAIFVWNKFPGLEKAGIAMKGLFNQNPVIYTKHKEITGLPQDLIYKLTNFLEFMPKIPNNEIWQGDFLFDDKSIKMEEIDGKKRIVFHPNTLIYLVPEELQPQILAAKVGVVWHTRYKGKSLNQAEAIFDFDEFPYKHKKCPEIFMMDAGINPALLGYFTDSEKRILDERFHRSLNIINSFKDKVILSNEEFVSYFKMYQNFVIKEKCAGLEIEGFKKFVKYKFDKEIEKRKSEKGKADVVNKCNDLINFITKSESDIKLIIMQINNFTAIKQIFLRLLNEYSVFNTYLKMKTGEIKRTNQEGYALSDDLGNVFKIVDREEFSYANFSPHVLKGWTKNI